MQAENKKVLLKIRNLKQYFPLKNKKNMFVKANDDITLDIYEGETFGLVGESGCGKSTLGRVLLQLYRQTFGDSLYYGRKTEDIAPEYVFDILKNYKKILARGEEYEKKSGEFLAEYDKLNESGGDEKQKYVCLEEHKKYKMLARKDKEGVLRLMGGFAFTAKSGEAAQGLIKYYGAAKERNKARATLDRAAKKGADGEKVKILKVRLDKAESELSSCAEGIQKLREEFKSDAAFSAGDEYLDGGADLARLKYSEMRKLRNELQIIFQDPYSSLNPRMTVGQIIGEGLRAHNINTDGDTQDYIMRTMEECGLASYMIHRYPHQFSGGQRQRIGIARALAVRPKFVVCDEAVSALDVSIQSQILNLLQDLKEKDNLTYLFISHDLSVIKYISDRVGVMYLGNIVELAETGELYRNPMHPYTEALLSAIPTTDADDENKKEAVILEGDIPSPINPPKGCKFHTRCRYKTDICSAVAPAFEEAEKNHFVACHHRRGGNNI